MTRKRSRDDDDSGPSITRPQRRKARRWLKQYTQKLKELNFPRCEIEHCDTPTEIGMTALGYCPIHMVVYMWYRGTIAAMREVMKEKVTSDVFTDFEGKVVEQFDDLTRDDLALFKTDPFLNIIRTLRFDEIENKEMFEQFLSERSELWVFNRFTANYKRVYSQLMGKMRESMINNRGRT